MAKKASKARKPRARGGKKNAEAPPARSKRLVWIVAACLIPVLLAGLSLYTKGLTTSVWNAVVKYKSPYLFQLEPVPATAKPSTGGVLLIIVDGLRVDTSKELDTWNTARNGFGSTPPGADLTAITGQPSLSDPAAAVIPSGTTQEIHGVTTNWYEGLLRVDNVFTAAKRSGKTTTVVAGKGWVDLYGDTIGTMYKYDDSAGDYDQMVFDRTLSILQAAKTPGGQPLPDLLIVHFSAVDNASHEFGALSPENLAAAKAIDGYIGRLLADYDLANRTAILTADHGHIATGGHGGWEPEVITVPLVFFGKSVTSGKMPAANQWDIAPTISALLGMSMPSETVGKILDSVIAPPAEDLAKAYIDLGHTRYRFAQAYVQEVEKNLPPSQGLSDTESNVADGNGLVDQGWVNLVAGDPARAVEAAKGGLFLMDQAQAKVKAIRIAEERKSRLGTSILLVLLPLLPLFYLGRNRWAGLALGGGVAYFALQALLFYVVRGFKLSLSIFNEESMIQSFFNARMIDAAAVAILVGIIFGLVVGWRKKYAGAELAEGAATVSYLIAYGLGLQIVLFYYLFGIKFDWYIPNLVWGFKFYADCLQMVPTGLASIAVVPLAVVAAKVAAVLGRGRSTTPPVSAK